MGIFDRLSDVIKSYLNDTGPNFSSGPSTGQRYADPDLNAAYEELDDFLGEKTKADEAGSQGDTWKNSFSQGGGAGNTDSKAPPEGLRGDFDALGVPFGASAEECKAAYKKLLKLHHPDRHAGHEGNMKKATEKSARINAAYDRIEKWRATGKTG